VEVTRIWADAVGDDQIGRSRSAIWIARFIFSNREPAKID
jgi:hypothetical protein